MSVGWALCGHGRPRQEQAAPAGLDSDDSSPVGDTNDSNDTPGSSAGVCLLPSHLLSSIRSEA